MAQSAQKISRLSVFVISRPYESIWEAVEAYHINQMEASAMALYP